MVGECWQHHHLHAHGCCALGWSGVGRGASARVCALWVCARAGQTLAYRHPPAHRRPSSATCPQQQHHSPTMASLLSLPEHFMGELYALLPDAQTRRAFLQCCKEVHDSPTVLDRIAGHDRRSKAAHSNKVFDQRNHRWIAMRSRKGQRFKSSRTRSTSFLLFFPLVFSPT